MCIKRNFNKCICDNNWKSLIKRYDYLIGSIYKDNIDTEYVFFGLVWADDDYYYGMRKLQDNTLVLLSCVSEIESFDFRLYKSKFCINQE